MPTNPSSTLHQRVEQATIELGRLMPMSACHNCLAWRDLARTYAVLLADQEQAHKAALTAAEGDLAWIRKKIGVPPDAEMFTGQETIAGRLHVICSNSHGYLTYIVAYKCDDKQGEIARLTVAKEAAEADRQRLRRAMGATLRELLDVEDTKRQAEAICARHGSIDSAAYERGYADGVKLSRHKVEALLSSSSEESQ